MKFQIGQETKQRDGYNAFTPSTFPPKKVANFSQNIFIKLAKADRLIGKLDGLTQILPDRNFFLKMFVIKDAESSAQIEGTKATIVDALEKEAGIAESRTDADDILFYIEAFNYGIKRIKSFPLSLRFIREIHKKLMTGARASHRSDPGEFRKTQNWIGGTSPENALFVPPPVEDMKYALNDFEKFIHRKDFLPLIHIALAHAQFETIHPFLDGNGRTGRLLITILMHEKELLEKPVLFLSSYFKKHQKVYYQRLNNYHNGGEVEKWVDFFIDGVISTAEESIVISQKIRRIRDNDMKKIQALGKREAKSSMIVLSNLFASPIVTSSQVMKWTGFTRTGALRVLDRFVKLGILHKTRDKAKSEKTYIYKHYFWCFVDLKQIKFAK